MITDLDAAKFCAAIYTDASDWDTRIEIGGIVAGIKYVNGGTVVAFRGSFTLEDWLRDADEIPFDHPVLGYVHRGFFDGMEQFVADIRTYLKGDIYVVGHSLGGAHACLFTGLVPDSVKRLVLFGCPRPGFSKLRNVVQLKCSNIASFRNREDPVPEVPYLLGLYHWVHDPAQITSATNPALPTDCHSIALYIEALSA